MNHLIYEVSKKMGVPFHSAGTAQTKRGANYITWQIISDVPLQTIDYRSETSKVRLQFDIYAQQEEVAFVISDNLEKEMNGEGLVLARNGPFFDVDTKMYRRTIDMSVLKGNRYE